MKGIKKIIYMGRSNILYTKHKKAMAHINFMGLYKEKFKDLQEFHDQKVVLCKVCTELGFRFEDVKKRPRQYC